MTFNAYDRFHHLFTLVAGEPVHAHIKRVRMEKAAFLLKYSDYSIGDIAYLVGFGSNASLSKAFNNHFDLSPKCYRNGCAIRINRQHRQYLVNYEHPEIKRLPEKEMVFLRTYGLHNIIPLWQKLFIVQKTYHAVLGLNANLARNTAEIIFKSPDFADITPIDLCRWDVGISSDKESLKGFINLDEDESMKHQVIPAGKYAVYLHQGSGFRIMDSYEAILHEGLQEQGFKIRNGINYHKYLKIDLTGTSLVELYFPIN